MRSLAIVLAVVLASPAAADASSEADLQYSLGTEFYKQRRYEEALQHFIASNRLVPNANVAFNIAQTYALLRRDAEAFNWYETYLGFARVDEAGRERARKAIAALLPVLAIVDVTTSPPGAELFIDRTELGSVGFSPRRLAVAPGERAVIARVPGFHDERTTFKATTSVSTSVALSLRPVVGTLEVETEPTNASVRREDSGELLGTTPLRLTLPVGELRLVISREGYVEQQRTAVLKADTTSKINVTFAMAASQVSVLTVQGTPESARVRLGDRELGSVPLSQPGLLPGKFTVTVNAPDHEPWTAQVLLEPGAATRLVVRLASTAERNRKVQWIGYGAGAAALVSGAVVGLVALTGRAAFFTAPSRAAYDAVQTQNVAADVLMIGGLVTFAATVLFDLVFFPRPQSTGEINVVR